ncbi:hypothetical protein LY76DRAFT_163322 [Colletotrichum caudatum]|nr:hypothetical protein LY76DRAFT_163322 [Colletotrichum caudatum]
MHVCTWSAEPIPGPSKLSYRLVYALLPIRVESSRVGDETQCGFTYKLVTETKHMGLVSHPIQPGPSDLSVALSLSLFLSPKKGAMTGRPNQQHDPPRMGEDMPLSSILTHIHIYTRGEGRMQQPHPANHRSRPPPRTQSTRPAKCKRKPNRTEPHHTTAPHHTRSHTHTQTSPTRSRSAAQRAW